VVTSAISLELTKSRLMFRQLSSNNEPRQEVEKQARGSPGRLSDEPRKGIIAVMKVCDDDPNSPRK
jgi:hypothetical protein